MDRPKKPVDPHSLVASPEEDKAPVDRIEVLPDEVKACAKSRCPRCWGKGVFIVSHAVVLEDPETKARGSIPGPPEEALCHCALKKFLKANIEKLDIDFGTNAGKMWWRVPTATPPPSIEKTREEVAKEGAP